jgi:uncharacterized protein YdeI (YjbR/CyaY-like superfamily)
MAARDSRIDVYIEKSAEFARPILEHVRALVHEACPGVEETIKWGMPTFVHAGAILCGMAAFKQHASFGFWRHAEVVGGERNEGMGSFGKLTSVRDLPPKRKLLTHLRKAMRLNEAGPQATTARKTSAPKPVPSIPADFAAALREAPAARANFDAFAPSHRREYLEWILEAKRPETRARRIAQAVAWLAEGKSRNWKYENCRAWAYAVTAAQAVPDRAAGT